MKLRSRAAGGAALLLSCWLALPGMTMAEEPAVPTQAWLSGTFGTVLGTDTDRPATAPPDGRPLAAWMREETLEIVVEPPLGAGDELALTAAGADSDSSVELSVTDGRWVTGPDEAGVHTVVAAIDRQDAEPTRHAWLLEVGDRPAGWDTLLQRPPLEARLVAEDGVVVGERGHGCLTGFCQEAGYRPPADTLQPLSVAVGEPLGLELADGSAIVHWQGRAEPRAGTRSEVRLAEATFDVPVAGPTLTGLEPDAAGEWLLEVRADYDRERGWQWYLFRLEAE